MQRIIGELSVKDNYIGEGINNPQHEMLIFLLIAYSQYELLTVNVRLLNNLPTQVTQIPHNLTIIEYALHPITTLSNNNHSRLHSKQI